MTINPTGIEAWQPLPRKVHVKNHALYLVHRNKWWLLGRTAAGAKAEYLRITAELGIPVVMHEFFINLVEKARSRAKRLRVPFTITLEDVRQMYADSGGRCALSGLPLDCANARSFARRPWIPSLDRKVPSVGYTKANTRLICFAMNAALNEWGEDAFAKLATGFLARAATLPVSTAVPGRT